MPVVTINKKQFFANLGKEFTEEEFDDLCFQFGIEVEFVTQEKEEQIRIEVGANRYDLLCEEGIIQALRVFLGLQEIPKYKVEPYKLVMNVSKNVEQVRPYVVCAVLRGVKFTKESYQNFIELQDKLHQNICRKRTLVAIGTHDLSTIQGPFLYDALEPSKIKFVPLNKTKEFTAEEFMIHCQSEDLHLKPYTQILKDKKVYPVIFDKNSTILSFPPLINSNHSKMSEETRDVFIESTATDKTKAYIVLNTIVTSFSRYCSSPFTVEQVKVVYSDGTEDITPKLEEREIECSVDYILKRIGVKSIDNIPALLKKMQLNSVQEKNLLKVTVPCFRSDILHQCDIMEDVAISYGFNNIPRTIPQVVTIGKQLSINKLSDLLRQIVANAGYTEVLTLSLLTKEDEYTKMNKTFDHSAVEISNAKYHCVRTSLLSGLLSSLKNNLKMGVPLKIFEISDVILKNEKVDVGCMNVRHLSALYCNTKGEMENIHGLLDRLMESQSKTYELKPSSNSTFWEKRQANIIVKGESVGIMGMIHPKVLEAFGINFPCCAIEINLEK